MNTYSSYKDSGIEWIGEIPSEWNIVKTKYMTSPRKELSDSGKEELLSVSEYLGVIPRSVIRKGKGSLSRSESLIGYLKVYKGDLVNNIMLMWKKGLGVSQYDGIVSPAYSVFNFIESVPSYYHYLYRTDRYITEFRKNSTGVIMSRLRLYDDDFGDIPSVIPSLQEQQQISDYLDHKTLNIDTLIKKTEQKIELLKEQRISLISTTVTKGLNSNVEMKDSGVEWIGEIPSGWSLSKIKYLPNEEKNSFTDGDWIESKDLSDSGIRYITSGNIGSGNYKEQGSGYITEETFNKLKCTELFPGDLVMSRLFLPVGRSCILPNLNNRVITAVDNVILRPKECYSNFFLNFFFNSFYYSEHSKLISRGVTLTRISRGMLGNVHVVVPPLQEQQQIVDYLDKETSRIDKLVDIESKRIVLLKEYRQSLISEVVTGKVDVRDEVLV